jgi:carbonic anhydrase
MPANAKEPLYRRLWEVLSGKDRSPAFAYLTDSDRRAILEILVATKPSLPEYFRAGL